MKSYNGHRSWNAWNVNLWLTSDEGLYRWALDLVNAYGKGNAAEELTRALEGEKTPDGANYNKTCIREALRGF